MKRILASLLALVATAALADITIPITGGGIPTNITSPSNGQCLTYQSSTQTWINSSCLAGGAAGANPTAVIGTSAVNGSASSFMRSDAAPALDLTLAPTWTGTHSFTAGLVASGVGSDNQSTILLNGTQVATASTVGRGIFIGQTYNPTAGLNVDGIQEQIHLGATANTPNFEGLFIASMIVDSGYTGTSPAVTQIEDCNVWTDNRAGGIAGNTITNFRCFQADPITANSGITSGTGNNFQFYANGGTSTSAGAGANATVNNINFRADLAQGASNGSGAVTNNVVLQARGNGGTNVSGTTSNWVIDSTSTADSKFTGGLDFTPIGATSASTGAFTTLSASSTVTGTGFSTYLASPPAIGGSAAAAITGTTVSATTNFVHGTTTLCQVNNAAATSHTGDTAETNLATCAVPAGIMGTQGKLRVTATWLRTAVTTNTITYTVRLSTSANATTGFSLASTQATSGNVSVRTIAEILNTSASAQQGFPNMAVNGGQSSAPTTGAINTANASWVNLSCADTTSSADTCGLYSYTVELVSP